jgi:hypothetical protein
MLEKRAVTQNIQVELLHPGDRVKTAGAMPDVQRVLDSLRPEPAYTYAFVNAMGYSEFYGTNSNADWYGHCAELDFNGLLHAWPDIGQNLETDRMKGRDWPYGYPCFYGAAVYAHHKNSCPTELGFGDVRYVFANPVMKRVELLMRIHNEEARKKGHLNIVERIKAGERCDVSMGAKIPWDACSICTDWDAVKRAWATFDPMRHKHPGLAVLEQHKKKAIRGIAVTAVDYCSHIRTQRNQVLPDGRRAFMYNVFPRFFDISCVFIGADRTARVMWHLADSFRDDAPIPQPLRVARLGLESLFSKTASKQAELEKEIPNGVIEKVLHDSDSAPEIRFDLMNQEPKQLLSSAAALGIVLSPTEFQRLLGGPGVPFSTASSKIDDSLAVGPRHLDEKLLSALTALVPERSAFRPFVEPRITTISGQIRITHPTCPHEEQKLAALYNGYRLSILEAGEKLAARASGHLVDDPFGLKTAAHPLAALLLGMAPVVHLVAAHLRRKQDEGQQLGTMAALVAENPTFISLAVLGAGIRVAMAAESGGLLPAALSLFAKAAKV